MISNVDISTVKDTAYYYCYHTIITDYKLHLEQQVQSNSILQQCAYCDDKVFGVATHYVPNIS